MQKLRLLVDKIIIKFVRLLLARRAKDPAVGPIALKATGVITLPDDKQDREILEEALAEKYGLEQ